VNRNTEYSPELKIKEIILSNFYRYKLRQSCWGFYGFFCERIFWR